MENLAGLVVFARVVEAQSFSEAARRLGMSPSMVSKQVARLERSLGTRLLNRTTRKLSVTEVGATVYEHCARIAREAEEVDLAVAQLQSEPRGRLKLSAPANFGMLHLSAVVAEFLQQYPDMSIDLMLNDRVAVDLVEDGLDAALVIATGPSENVVARPLAPIRWVLCGAPDYLRRHGTPATVAEIADHNCLVYPNLQHVGAWRFRGPEGEQNADVHSNFRVNSSLAIRGAALAGLGLAVLPTFLVGPDLKTGALKIVLPDHQPFRESALQAIYLPGRPVPAKLRAFLDVCAARFGPNPHWDEGIPELRHGVGAHHG
ncbi:MAG: LysR family transcriptional regulator [Burkholderiales bacterium]|nr:LysR family transcriptional regulator [Burkholderiales bacterium]